MRKDRLNIQFVTVDIIQSTYYSHVFVTVVKLIDIHPCLKFHLYCLRLEEMTSDKAQFDTTLKNLERHLEETSEELNKVSIECDVWRSKFLASRFVTELKKAFNHVTKAYCVPTEITE